MTKQFRIINTKKGVLDINSEALQEVAPDVHLLPRNFTYNQGTPSTVWTISHPLEKKPSVTILTSAGDEVQGNVRYLEDNKTIIITFNFAFSGQAILN